MNPKKLSPAMERVLRMAAKGWTVGKFASDEPGCRERLANGYFVDWKFRPNTLKALIRMGFLCPAGALNCRRVYELTEQGKAYCRSRSFGEGV